MFGKSFNFLEHEVRKLGSVAYGIKNKKITKLKNDGHKICKKIEFFYLIIDSSVLKILKKKNLFFRSPNLPRKRVCSTYIEQITRSQSTYIYSVQMLRWRMHDSTRAWRCLSPDNCLWYRAWYTTFVIAVTFFADMKRRIRAGKKKSRPFASKKSVYR